jgi:DNA-3-methyladenine glycosylase II
MGLSAEQIRIAMDALAATEPAFAAGLARVGYPPPRIRQRGYATLLRTILGQQVSVASAAAVYRKLETLVGDPGDPHAILAASDETLRAAGLSRQKASYARSLADEVTSGRLDLDHLSGEDEAAIAQLVRVKGIGRWSAEIYLLFAEGRPDIWPAGDLAVQIEIGRLLGHDERPSEKLTRELAEAWRPHRGALAIFTWHHYGAGPDATAAPV